ncbi:MAG TPA: T9SS type A sorting domain-containing protein [Chitinophagaceae bacterium]
MKRILLLLAVTAITTSIFAQKTQKNSAYAITGLEKGRAGWTEVRLVDLTTGESIKSIYESAQEIEILNARTGKPVRKQEAKYAANTVTPMRQMVMTRTLKDGTKETVKVSYAETKVSADKPFATTSAACAYDKKHERLYYTPMGINQLRYIDLKSKSPRVYYFEDDVFGALSSRHDVANQITRMVIASDGNGYALTNNAAHLFRFTTGKNPSISDLGALSDAEGNLVSIHNRSLYGGDIIADTKENLYLVSSNRHVFKISIDSRIATYLGPITGLPRGFTTNAATVESGTSIVVASSNSTIGYYKFDLKTLIAEKITSSQSVFNASDLAGATLLNEKKKKERNQNVPQTLVDKKISETVTAQKQPGPENVIMNKISVFPNPVTNGYVRISFEDQPAGKYQIQFMDISGKMISTQDVTVNGKLQVETFSHPRLMSRGNYMLKVVNQSTQEAITSKILVQ